MRALEFAANTPIPIKYTEALSGTLAWSVSALHLPVTHATVLSENDFR